MATDFKHRFAATPGIYLLNHSVGLPPADSEAVWAETFLGPWKQGSDAAWNGWLAAVYAFRESLAELLNTQAALICPQVNLSSALTKLLQSLTVPEQRRTILHTDQDFPSINFVLQQLRNAGFSLRRLPDHADAADPECWSTLLDDPVGIVLVTHVHSNTGRQVPVDEITRMARDRGVLTIVDVAQSAGCIPIDLQTWNADFVIGSCVKWLCGGPGAGFLWVDGDRLADCRPVDVGWFSHEDPFEFDSDNFRYAPGALRFWGGTPSIQPYVTAGNSIRLLHAIGIDRIRRHNLALTTALMEVIDPGHLVTPVAPAHRGGTVVVNLPDALQDEVAQELQRAAVSYDIRPTGIRLSPHIYNDLEEVAVVADLLASAYR